MKYWMSIVALAFVVAVGAVGANQQQPPRDTVSAPPPTDLADEAQVFEAGGHPFRVVPIKGLQNPWALAFLPNGDILVTEQVGRLRIVQNGTLDPQPISGMPDDVNTRVPHGGLYDIAVHPQYAENGFIYFTYAKSRIGNAFDDFRWDGANRVEGSKREAAAVALVRARYDGGSSLTDVKEIFLADAWAQGSSAGRLVFGLDGKIILSVGLPTRHQVGTAEMAQDPANHAGKILRLNDDGTVPADNPFVGRVGYRPEIYAFGIRNALGLFVHPETGELWETENGPMGGDEINIIKPGRNYGWPVISYGRDYRGERLGGLSGTTSEDRTRTGMEEPFWFWSPSPAVAGIVIYTGDKFPNWKGNVFIGALGAQGVGARQLQRMVLNRQGFPQRQGTQSMLAELQQRIRDVKQGPDGLLYLTIDERDGGILRIEPVEPKPSAP